MTIKEIEERIKKLGEECGENNWDGEDGAAITTEVCEKALQFLFALPKDFIESLSGVDPGSPGYISFEWYVNGKNQFSVDVYPNGKLIYGGCVEIAGECDFSCEWLHKEILEALKLIIKKQALNLAEKR